MTATTKPIRTFRVKMHFIILTTAANKQVTSSLQISQMFHEVDGTQASRIRKRTEALVSDSYLLTHVP